MTDKDEDKEEIKWKEKRIKLMAFSIILILMISAILGAITLVFIYNPHDNEFIVTFNGKTKDGIIATTYTDENHTDINEKFRSLFARDLSKIANDTFFVDGITINNEYWFWIVNSAVVTVDGKGWYILESAKSKIEGLWYVERVTYNDPCKVI